MSYLDTPLEISQKYKDALQEVHAQIESETGEMYQFKVEKFDTRNNECHYVGKFIGRNKRIEIYDMKTSYFDMFSDQNRSLPEDVLQLNGIYNNIKEFEDKIVEISRKNRSLDINISENSYNVYRSCGICYEIGKWRYIS